jgi:predicted nucleic acid-binding protein
MADSPVAFVDSSALVALADRDDRSHRAVVDAYRSLLDAGYRLFTTDHVLAEAFELLSLGIGTEAARAWLRDCRLAVYDVTEDDVTKARELVLGRPLDRQLSLTDAISIVVMERLAVTDAFAVDQNFLAEMG